MNNTINKGDLVLYWDTRSIKQGNRVKVIKVGLVGKWDGEKVVCNDREHTTIRNKEWLIKVSDLNKQKYESNSNRKTFKGFIRQLFKFN